MSEILVKLGLACNFWKLWNVFSIVSQLQAEIDNLMLHVVFTQAVSEDLRSNVKAMKNARHKAGAEKSQAEEQKLKQVDRLKSGTLKTSDLLKFWMYLASSLIICCYWLKLLLCH